MLIANTKLINMELLKMQLIIHLDHLHLLSNLKLEGNNNPGKVKNQKYTNLLKLISCERCNHKVEEDPKHLLWECKASGFTGLFFHISHVHCIMSKSSKFLFLNCT